MCACWCVCLGVCWAKHSTFSFHRWKEGMATLCWSELPAEGELRGDVSTLRMDKVIRYYDYYHTLLLLL